MAFAITKTNSVSTPKYLLTKKEISEEEFNSLLGSNNKHGNNEVSKPFSFSADRNEHSQGQGQRHSKYKKHLISNDNNDGYSGNENDNNNTNKAIIANELKQKLLHNDPLLQSKPKDEYKRNILEYKSKSKSDSIKEHQKDSDITDQELNKKWQDNYEDLLNECKANDNRNQKEKLLEEKMKEKLEAQIKKDLIKTEYPRVVDKIRREVEQEIAKEFIQKKQREIEHIKKKIEYSTQIKLLEYEKQLMLQYRNDYEKEKKEILIEKEKEIKAMYEDKLIQMKEKAKKDLNEKYTAMGNELVKEIEDMKSQFAIQSEKEKKRLAKLNEMQFSCRKEEYIHKEKGKEINSMLNKCKKNEKAPVMGIRKSNSKSNISTRNMMNMNANANLNTDDVSQVYQSNNNNNNNSNERTVNIFEMNKRIRYSSPRNERTDDEYNINTNINIKGKEYNHFLIKK